MQQGQSGYGLSNTINKMCFLAASLLVAYFVLKRISGVDQASYDDLPF